MKHEDDILQLLKKGDKQGLELLFKKFYRPLVVYACKFVDSESQAEDLVQDVFISFWEGDKFTSVKNYLRAYLYNSVKNKCLNHLRAKPKNIIVGLELYESSIPDMFLDDTQLNKQLADVIKEVDKLPQRTREVFIAVYFYKMSYSEIAEELDISKNTVKTTLSRAMKGLRERLHANSILLFLTFI